MKKRIPEQVLPAKYYDGEVLYGSEVNKIVTVLREGVNANNFDINKLVDGSSGELVFYSIDEANEYFSKHSLPEGTLCVVWNGGEYEENLTVYKYLNGALEVYFNELSLLNLLENGESGVKTLPTTVLENGVDVTKNSEATIEIIQTESIDLMRFKTMTTPFNFKTFEFANEADNIIKPYRDSIVFNMNPYRE